jgi:hypothetical protein
VNFVQTIRVRSDEPDVLAEMLREWDADQSTADIMGYMGSHLYCDRENPGHYLIVAEFGVVDPDVTAAEEALRNNDRPETQAWAQRLLEHIQGEPQYHHYDELYRTG